MSGAGVVNSLKLFLSPYPIDMGEIFLGDGLLYLK